MLELVIRLSWAGSLHKQRRWPGERLAAPEYYASPKRSNGVLLGDGQQVMLLPGYLFDQATASLWLLVSIAVRSPRMANAICNCGDVFADCAAHLLSQQIFLGKLLPGTYSTIGYVDDVAP